MGRAPKTGFSRSDAVQKGKRGYGVSQLLDSDTFITALERELKRRYDLCEDSAATPSSILLAVLNAVAQARISAENVKAKRGGSE